MRWMSWRRLLSRRMKRLIACSALMLCCLACQRQRTAEIYEGVFPAADCAGIEYSVTLNADIVGRDTMFVMTQTYLEGGEDGSDVSFEICGLQREKGSRYVELHAEDSDEVFTFYRVDNNTLRLTGDGQAQSGNYEVKRK